MKKLLIALCITFAGLTAAAQEKGDMAVGGNIGAAHCTEKGSDITNFGIGAKFQYNITDPIRVEGALTKWFKDNKIDVFEGAANFHYLFNVAESLKVYPLVGLGVARVGWSEPMGDGFNRTKSDTKMLFNIGVGAEYHVSKKVAIGAEVKFQYIKDYCRLPVMVGATYFL